jgi:hypothetical protein
MKSVALKEPAQKRRRFHRDADNLVRGLPIEFEIELGLGSAVVPVGRRFELAPPQAPLGERGALEGDEAARDQTGPAFVLARDSLRKQTEQASFSQEILA